MGHKKRQHFVPQFYLRNFACDSKRKAINLYNLKNEKYITNSSIRDQCYKDYFYGKDLTIENALGSIEGATAKILSAIISKGSFPERTTADHTTIKLFILSQVARTERAEEETHKTAIQLFRFHLSRDKEAQRLLQGKERLNDIPIKLTDPIKLSLSNAAKSLPLVMDLDYKVLYNATNVSFITSDNPAIKYNQLCEIKKVSRYNTGFAARGLQIFLPISAKHCMLFYDEEVYRVGNRKDDIVSITDERSITGINGLQVVNCYENLYYDQSCSTSYIYDIVGNYLPLRKKLNARQEEWFSMRFSDNSSPPRHFDNRINLQISNLHIFPSAKAFLPSDKAIPVRNEKLIAVHNNFLQQVEEGIYESTKWQKFLSDKALNPYQKD